MKTPGHLLAMRRFYNAMKDEPPFIREAHLGFLRGIFFDRDVKYGEAAVAIGEALRLAAGVDSSHDG